MSKEYTQALDDLLRLVAFLPRESFKTAQKYFDIIEPALHRLESIDNANPNEALEIIRKYKNSDYLNTWNPKFVEALKTVENYILKAQEQEKFLDDNLIFKNGHFMSGFNYKGKEIVAMPLNEYDRLMKEEEVLELIKEKSVNLEVLDISNNVDCYNKVIRRYSVYCKELAEEEFDLLKKWSERK